MTRGGLGEHRPVRAGRAGFRVAGPYPASSQLRPVFDHLAALTDERGLFEHALHSTPRPEHGYCVDDAARGLVVTCREPDPSPVVQRLRSCYLRFVISALRPDGTCHNRFDSEGRLRDEAGLGDWWGRALWSLGVAAAHADTASMRSTALVSFRIAAQQRSPFSRSMAFAALGAAELLRVAPGEPAAQRLLRDAMEAVGAGGTGTRHDWPWPEPRLRYANAIVAEALLVAGEALPDQASLAHGLDLLAFLLQVETYQGRLSVTPVAGRGPGESGPGYDQQPIEVAAIADACATAYRITTGPRWLDGIRMAWRWFLGDNDSRTPMFDPVTGAGYDGLQPDGRNLNQGAESTLAMLSTAQHARRIQEML
jgi:hypothetical protein